VPVNPENPYSPVRPEGGTFGGKVKSDNGKCQNERSVSVFDPNGTTLGKDKTNENGAWSVKVSGTIIQAGEYQAEAAKRVIKKKKKNGDIIKTICKPATKNFQIP
jgi:hypothetical protein